MATATETELVAALRREPLVYADWLMDRGDTRGELIVLQEREAELDGAQLLRLLELSADHGFMRLPVDPDEDVLRFAGGFSSGSVVEYEVIHGGHAYRVVASSKLVVMVDREVAYVNVPREMVRPEAANAVLSCISDAILLDEPLDKLALPDDLTTDLRYRIGRFPTEPVPDDIAAHLPPGRRHIDFRDLARWRALANRWRAL
jgi:uncharacterized protein (TIGR02996 family)